MTDEVADDREDPDGPLLRRLAPDQRRQVARFREVLGPAGLLSEPDLGARRALHARLERGVAARSGAVAVRRRDRVIPGARGRPDVAVRVHTPVAVADRAGATGAVLHLHGGGLVLGDLDSEDHDAAALAAAADVVVVSVDYRLAPEHRHPAALDDCVTALTWVASDAGPAGGGGVVVLGTSAGGGLALALALRARAEGLPQIAQLVLAEPMLDDRGGPRANHVPLGVWDVGHHDEAWRLALGDVVGGPQVPELAAPGRARDLRGLPPTYVDVGALDLFLDEALDLTRRLAAADVEVELHVLPGTCHGAAHLAPRSQAATFARTHRVRAVRRALGR